MGCGCRKNTDALAKAKAEAEKKAAEYKALLEKRANRKIFL